MNKKQWFVLGIGLILLSFFFSFLGTQNDCSALQEDSIKRQEKLLESGADIQDIVGISSDAWVISCFDTNIAITSTSTIIFTLGIIFIILGFLEDKKKKGG